MSLPNGSHTRPNASPTDIPRPSFMSPEGVFDIFEWHPAYVSCQKYFIDHAQHSSAVQTVSALINILLPHQWSAHPVKYTSPSATNQNPPFGPYGTYLKQEEEDQQNTGLKLVSLVPYIRRLIVTGFDREPLLHGFFGDDWRKGVGVLQECERRNYLFAAKSGGWASVKAQYDMGPHETVPFLQQLRDVQLEELEAAERQWSQWLATEDWMIGPRAVDHQRRPF